MSHTIADVKRFPLGTVVPLVSGTVKAVFPRKTGEGQYGPWTVQTVILADGPDEIHVSCWGFDDLAHLKGQEVQVAATGKNGKTGKQQGTELKQGKDKEGNPRAELHVSHKTGGFIGSGTPNPAHMAGGQTAPETPIAANPGPSKPQTRGIEGVTVGMAVNCAVRLCAANQIPPENQDEYIHEKASALIRLSQRLQAGELL